MRAMYKGYALPKPGFESADVVRIASEIAGTDMSPFFQRYLNAKDPLPYDRDFGYAGVAVQRSTPAAGWSGVVFATTRDGKPAVSNIIPGSPAERDGLDRGDIVTNIDQQAVTPDDVGRMLATRHPGDRVTFTVLHHGASRDVPVTLSADPHPTYTLSPIATPSPRQQAIYRGVLSGEQPSL
jgi:predicted metalloprotease with PDZ domain